MTTTYIISIQTRSDTYKELEFQELLKACDLEVIKAFRQDVKHIDFRTYIGSGKVQEIAEFLHEKDIQSIYFDIDLTPLQVRNLEEAFHIPVIDREELILEIFHQRATTKVARLQIELAQLKKILPRLIGSNTQLSRQAGGKNKGTGEKQLELDRRRIKTRITELEKDLKQIEKERKTQRRQRTKGALPFVALVGYTNAGKSTLMNCLLRMSSQKEEKQVLQKDMLFATLDTTVRRISIENHPDFLLSDTVGFISDLPHNLIKAFQSTLEEISYADLLIQVVDASDEHRMTQMQITEQTLQELNVSHIPMITVYNKCDRSSFTYPKLIRDTVYVSWKEEQGLDILLQRIDQKLYGDMKSFTLLIPYEQGDILHSILERYPITALDHTTDGTMLQLQLNEQQKSRYLQYIVSDIH